MSSSYRFGKSSWVSSARVDICINFWWGEPLAAEGSALGSGRSVTPSGRAKASPLSHRDSEPPSKGLGWWTSQLANASSSKSSLNWVSVSWKVSYCSGHGKHLGVDRCSTHLPTKSGLVSFHFESLGSLPWQIRVSLPSPEGSGHLGLEPDR